MQYSKEEKIMWLEDWRQSGKSAWVYAKENGLVPQTFTSWTKTRSKNKQPLVEVPAQTLQCQIHHKALIIEKGEVKIHIPLTVDSEELQKFIVTLAAAL
jgi:hypothetical protein